MAQLYTKTITGTLQTVLYGTGKETYALVKAELASVGIDDWEAERRRADANLCIFCFGTDAGPDNLGMAMRVRTATAPFALLAFLWTFCLFHQGHLISKCLLKVHPL